MMMVKCALICILNLSGVSTQEHSTNVHRVALTEQISWHTTNTSFPELQLDAIVNCFFPREMQ
jgi:hypothetical protein